MIISIDSLPGHLEQIGIDDEDVSIGDTADNRLTVEERFAATGELLKVDVDNLREVTTQVWPEVTPGES